MENLTSITEEQRSGGQEGRLFNNNDIDEIPQKQQTENNHSTIQPFNHSTDNGYTSKKAFTLAEVLITLGVIGVVAAMTLPTLIQNYKKTVYVNQLKKSYSLLEQAFQKMLADDEVQNLSDTSVWATIKDVSVWPNDFFVTDDRGKNFITNLGKYLRIIGVEQFGEDRYRLEGTKLPDEWKNKYAIALSDGTMIFLAPKSTIRTKECNPIKELGGNMCSYAGSIEIDVNGRRRPNTWGRDQFSFSISDEGKLYPFSGKDEALYQSAQPIENNGEYWKIQGSCGTPEGDVSDTRGDGCAARIIENGWKMDY